MTVSYRKEGMTRAELEEILATHSGLAAEVFVGQDEVPLEGLGMESLAAMEIQAVIKEQHEVIIPEDEIPGMSINDLLACVHALQQTSADATNDQEGD